MQKAHRSSMGQARIRGLNLEPLMSEVRSNGAFEAKHS